MNYTAIIIDDEGMAAEYLKLLIEKYYPEIFILSVCLKPQLGIDMIKQKKPDIVFLDIEMPGLSGFNLLGHVKDEIFECVFTTAYDKYAINAIKHNALDYLLKPINITDLRLAVNKAKIKIDSGKDKLSPWISKLISTIKDRDEDAFSIPVGGELFFVKANEVLYMEADSNYTHIYLDNDVKKKLTASKNLKKVEESIVNIDNFFRIHNSYIININNVVRFTKGLSKTVIMKGGKELEVSRTKSNELMRKLEKYFPRLF